MGLRFDPVGGGQFKAAIRAIVEADSQPIKQLQERKARDEAKLKLLGEFKSKFTNFDKALDEMSSFSKFRELKVDLGDGASQMAVTVDKDRAQPGSYEMEIDQLAARTSIISNGFSDPDDPVLGMGYIVMNPTHGDSQEIYIEQNQSSLHGIAAAINRDDKSLVHASVVRDGSDADNPWRLVITAKKDGEQQQIDFPDFYFMDSSTDFYIDDDREADNAIVQFNGFTIEPESNDVKDFLDGVNVHLKQAKPDQPFTMNITEDYEKVAGKMKAVIDQVNQILEFINKQNQIDEHTDTRSTFAGDSTLQSIEYRLRNLVQEAFPSTEDMDDPSFHLVHLNELGVEFQKTGQIDFKIDKFQKALEGDFQGIAYGISGPLGFVSQVRQVISGYTQTGNGLLSVREQGIRSRMKQYDDEIDQKSRQIDRKQQALTEQYARLEGTLSDMQRQSQYLSATLPSGGNNIVSQLLGG